MPLRAVDTTCIALYLAIRSSISSRINTLSFRAHCLQAADGAFRLDCVSNEPARHVQRCRLPWSKSTRTHDKTSDTCYLAHRALAQFSSKHLSRGRTTSTVKLNCFCPWIVANEVWASPVDVLLVELTTGAGRQHQTVCDYLHRINFADCHGELQEVSNLA